MNTPHSKRFSIFAGAGLLLLAAIQPLTAYAVEAIPSDDTYLSERLNGKPKVYGRMKDLRVQTARFRSLIKFDLSTLPANTTSGQVSKATLKLFVRKAKSVGTMQ